MRPVSIRGRGAAHDPPNRFEALHVEPDPEVPTGDPEDEQVGPLTRFYRDATRSIIATNDSPDIPFGASLNPYRGCEHGCIYCYARPTHEYLGFSAGLDFESRILVKVDAPELLRDALSARSWKPEVIAISGVTDPYQPVERRLALTRRCLEVLAEFRNPVSIITKNHLVTRDADVLERLSAHDCALVNISVTTLDNRLHHVMEPRTSVPAKRLAAIETFARRGIPVRVMVAPIIPGLTDHEIPRVLEACRDAGALGAGYVTLRLPHAVAPLFEDWLDRHFPERKQKVLNRVRSIRGGRLNDPRFGDRMRGEGPFADQIRSLFRATCRRLCLNERNFSLNTAAFRRPARGSQLGFFDE